MLVGVKYKVRISNRMPTVFGEAGLSIAPQIRMRLRRLVPMLGETLLNRCSPAVLCINLMGVFIRFPISRVLYRYYAAPAQLMTRP